MFQDLRYGWRMLLKHRGFTIVAILSLALGIGANTALFSVVDAVFLKNLSVAEPDRLVLFEWESGEKFRTSGMRGIFSGQRKGRRGTSMFRYDIYEKLRNEVTTSANSPLSDLWVFAPLWELTVVVNNQAELQEIQAVSGNYFQGMGVQPIAGRVITASDDNLSSEPVVVLSHSYWRDHLAGDPSIVGKQVKINGISFTVIGILRPEFVAALQIGQLPALTVPLAYEQRLLGEGTGRATAKRPDMWWLHMMGRLKPGASIEQARESLGGIFQAMAIDVMPPPKSEKDVAKLDPGDYPQLLAQSGSRGMMESRRRLSYRVYSLFIVVGIVLLIACANVANLLLARSALRAHEISLRLAVGAGRWRLIRQLLTESILLAVLGGVVGAIFAYGGMKALIAISDRHTDFIPTGVKLHLNWVVLLFTFGISLLTGILFGLAPAWQATSRGLHGVLKQSRASSTVSRLSKSLVVVQVALSLLLLIGAGLFIRTLYNLQHVKLGFNQENLLLFALDPKQGGYKDDRVKQFYDRLFERLDNLPGVRSATFGRIPLISHHMWNTDFLLPGETIKNSGQHETNRQHVRENYFATMEIPLMAGRIFETRDTQQAPKVVIVNQTFARKFFPDTEVLGKRIKEPEADFDYEIIGVVADSKYNSQRDEIEPLMYTYWLQGDSVSGMNFAIRATGDPASLTAAVRQAVRELDVNLPVNEVSTQVARSNSSLGQERLNARLLTFFGILALILAIVGLSGVLAYSVAQRTNEIGIRMALGAEQRDVLGMVVWQGMKLVLIGLAVGALAGYALKRLVQSEYLHFEYWQRQFGEQLYGVTATDPWTFGIIATVLLLAALGACWLPARRATRVDPLVALRYE